MPNRYFEEDQPQSVDVPGYAPPPVPDAYQAQMPNIPAPHDPNPYLDPTSYESLLNGPATQALTKHLSQFPAEYHPGIFRKILAGAAGASAGYFGGAGEGARVGQQVLDMPEHQRIGRWYQENYPLQQAAEIEARRAGHILDPMRLLLTQQHQERADKARAEQAAAATTRATTGQAQQQTREGNLDLRRQVAGYDSDLDPLSDDELSLAQKSHIDLTVASAALKRAQAEYEKTRNDPNSPAFKLVAARLAEAQKGHAIAAKKADTFAELINMRKYGMTGSTLGQGDILPGVAMTPSGGPLGTSTPGSEAQKLTGQDKNRRTAAEVINANAPELMKKVDDWKKLFGTYGGNLSKLTLAMRREGINLADINQQTESIIQTLAPLHGRNVQQAVADFRKAAPTFANNPAAFKQYLDSLMGFTKKVLKVTGPDRFYTGGDFDYGAGAKSYNELKQKYPGDSSIPKSKVDNWSKVKQSIIDEQ